ncbi:MAG: hypothetical protein ABI878_05595 [Acidobacteriota bacterium]
MRAEWKECPKDGISPQWSGFYVTMNKKGSIVISRATYKRLGEPVACMLLFDPANNRIGLQAATKSARNAYTVRPWGIYGGRVIYAYRLTQEFEIELAETVQFHDAHIDREGILVLDLRTATTSKRAWTKQRRESFGKNGAERTV